MFAFSACNTGAYGRQKSPGAGAGFQMAGLCAGMHAVAGHRCRFGCEALV